MNWVKHAFHLMVNQKKVDMLATTILGFRNYER